ncbi:ATP-binding cassette domain-containing protein [Microlunatus parietis]|uniref:Alpha-D-ribose 1-methylphosphonate 5-triphosphate synthase subunit PhnL n=1 Tax=Microlunatus parietis TaxID=682979 RepID=A0A7Y9I4E0_9ACTN|nr:ATP-binding cassette domain-containing protein [Microlunatus parietis]NYE69790.1 alpha-D-ribose 1-methylphosphonate 5-triphosphate synthase subunit PhnL [Microlunatus parietis]
MNSPILTVAELTKTFTLHAIGGRRVQSLDTVSFTLAAGEHLAIAGASGAGKSSLLRCLYRNYRPDSGRVILHTEAGDLELTSLPDRRMARLRGREFGYVSQFLVAPPRQDPLRLVAGAAQRRGLDPEAARAAAAASLDLLGLPERLFDVDCSLLSGGERQRVNLAAGTVSPPRLLLLDEPVSALDPANRARALAVIERLTEQGVSVLAVYHDLAIIRRMADRVLVLDGGRLVADGPPDKVLAAGHRALDDVMEEAYV